MTGGAEPAAPDGVDDFGAWVAARGGALQRFAFLVTGSANDAPDLVQEALSRAYPRWAALSRSDTAEAYVRRSIVNASISGWRKNRRLVAVGDPAPLVDATGHHHDTATGVTDADEAWRLCEQLPPRQRAAVVLRFYEDLSYAQIALVLDCTEPTARSYVHRALAALRTRFAEENAHD